jgi:ubiquinol-cytochrome c reductase cytochrome b subunit
LLKTIANWLDERTGSRSAIGAELDRPLPGGPRWGYVLGVCFAATLLVDLVTGLLLMTTYSPSATSAWGSVYFITYRMELGWFVRGLHRFGSFGSVVVGGLLLLRLVFSGAYRAPRELNWWLAVTMFLLVLVLGVTGNILPWDQRGYWAAVVEMTIAGGAPGAGPALKKVVVGGTEFGNQTLTRIHLLHVAVVPALLAGCLWGYFALFRRHGFDGPERPEKVEPYWPRQAFYQMAAAFAVLGVLVALTLAYHGYSLDAPADPSSDDYPARPEWYFFPLNQLLKVFQGRELIATMVIPGGVVAGLLLLPLLEKLLPRRLGHVAACSFVLTVAAGAGYLIYQAMAKDAHSDAYRAARTKADAAAHRAVALATLRGIPPEGSSYVLGRDPLTRGGDLFEKKCQGCHNAGQRKAAVQSAPDLKDYGSLTWVRGLLENPGSPDYYGKVPQCGGMQEWKKTSRLAADELDSVASYVASFAAIPPDVTPEEWLADPKVQGHPGRELYEGECAQCHTFGDPGSPADRIRPAPDLFAWGSDRWTNRMIKTPGSPNLYGYLDTARKKQQKMPAFGGQITDPDIATLVRYLKGDYDRPAASPGPGANPVSGPR